MRAVWYYAIYHRTNYPNLSSCWWNSFDAIDTKCDHFSIEWWYNAYWWLRRILGHRVAVFWIAYSSILDVPSHSMWRCSPNIDQISWSDSSTHHCRGRISPVAACVDTFQIWWIQRSRLYPTKWNRANDDNRVIVNRHHSDITSNGIDRSTRWMHHTRSWSDFVAVVWNRSSPYDHMLIECRRIWVDCLDSMFVRWLQCCEYIRQSHLSELDRVAQELDRLMTNHRCIAVACWNSKFCVIKAK